MDSPTLQTQRYPIVPNLGSTLEVAFQTPYPAAQLTQVGHSLGALVVLSALHSLAASGHRVRHVLLLGAAVPAAAPPFSAARSAVAGRLCNLHSPADRVLSRVYRVLCAEVPPAPRESGPGGLTHGQVETPCPGLQTAHMTI